jgi:hypothetical protein
MIIEVADRNAEKHFLSGKDGVRYSPEYAVKATKITAVAVNSHEGPTWS